MKSVNITFLMQCCGKILFLLFLHIVCVCVSIISNHCCQHSRFTWADPDAEQFFALLHFKKLISPRAQPHRSWLPATDALKLLVDIDDAAVQRRLSSTPLLLWGREKSPFLFPPAASDPGMKDEKSAAPPTSWD